MIVWNIGLCFAGWTHERESHVESTWSGLRGADGYSGGTQPFPVSDRIRGGVPWPQVSIHFPYLTVSRWNPATSCVNTGSGVEFHDLRWVSGLNKTTSCVSQGLGWNSMTSGEYQNGAQPLPVSHRVWDGIPWPQVSIKMEPNHFLCLTGSGVEFPDRIQGGVPWPQVGIKVEPNQFHNLRCVSEWNPTTSCVSQDPG